MTSGINFQSLNTFSLRNSSITSLGVVFDASHVPNISSLRKVSINDYGVVSYSQFTFQETNIVTINNLNWSGTGEYLFYNCTKLAHINGAITLKTSANHMFWRCQALEALPTITADSSLTVASYMFAGANLLSYNAVAAVIRACTNVTTFDHAFFCKKFDDNTDINLTTLF